MPQILRKCVQSLSELASRKSLAIQAGKISDFRTPKIRKRNLGREAPQI